MRLVLSVLLISQILTLAARSSAAEDFAITLERVGCLGNCPDYEVTILANGVVRYEGRSYVRVKGVRQRQIPVSVAQELARQLRNDDFLHWEEKEVA
jgi:hypothetical protein